MERALTDSEAVTIRSLLACRPISERERIRESGIPSRSFERARHRAYSEGWLSERYVPCLAKLGLPTITFALTCPHVDQIEAISEAWESDRQCVLLWKWPELLFGVFVSKETPSNLEDKLLGSGVEAVRMTIFAAEARMAQIPAYFDFEGCWSRFITHGGSEVYPHSVPMVSDERDTAQPYTEGELAKIRALIRRPFELPDPGRHLQTSPRFLPLSSRRLLSKGLVEKRVFLDLAKVPAYSGRKIAETVFVHGKLKDAKSADRYLQRLITIGVKPFLFVADGQRVLHCTLVSTPVLPWNAPRPNVMGSVQEFLQDIDVLRGPVGLMSVTVNHRYDRLV